MKKRLLLLLCLLVTAGSAAWANIASGNCKNGTWVIDDSGKLTVNMTGKMADYGEGKAPWYGYADKITAIHIGSGATNVGRNGFYGLTKVKSVTGGENVEAVAMYAFEECGVEGKIPEIYLPKCTYLGECSFRGCGALCIVLPVVEEVRTKAFASSPYLVQIDLGSKIEEIGVLAFSECPQMWYDNSPNIFMSNPTPPKLYTKMEASTEAKIKDAFKMMGYALAIVASYVLPAVGGGAGYLLGHYETDEDLTEGYIHHSPYWSYFQTSDDAKDHWYNPFAPMPDGEGWTNGEPVICVPANLVKTYRDYYFEAENMKTGNWGYIDDDAEGMGTDERIYAAHGAIMAGGMLGTSLNQGWWVIGSRNSKNELAVEPSPSEGWTEDALVFGGDLQKTGMSAVNALKSQVKAFYIGFNSTFPEGAFENWTNLEYVQMGKNSWISDRMFKGCTKLVTVEGNMQSVGISAFEGCTKLHNFLTDNESLKNVCNSAFKDCSDLYEVKLPGVKHIQAKAFMNCSNLRRVISSGLMSKNLSSQYDIEDIQESAFEGCESLYEISFQNLKQLGKRAFYGCTSLKEFTSGPYFSTVPEEAFANSGIVRIMQNGQTYYFLSKSFANCTNMSTDAYVDTNSRGIFDCNGTKGIGAPAADAFEGLNLSKLPLHCTPENWARTYSNDPVLGQMMLKNYDVEYKWSLENDGWELTPSGILSVGPKFFKSSAHITPEDYPWYPYRDWIKTVVIKDGVTTIYQNEFAGLGFAVDVHVPRTVTKIGESAFKGCWSLKNIYITQVENIGSNAFEGCYSMETIELGENLKTAGDYIFKGCWSLNYIKNMTDTPAKVTDLTFKEISSDTYQGRRGGRMSAKNDNGQSAIDLKVSDADVLKYMTDKNWGKFHIKYADGRGTWVKAGPFGDGMWILYEDGTMLVSADKGPGDDYNESSWRALGFNREVASKTKTLEFKGNIESMSWCFNDFTELETVKLCPSIKVLDQTFTNCEKLSSVNLQNVETIGEWTFSNTALTSLDLSNVKSLGKYAFENCHKLTKVKLGAECEVGVRVFFMCSNLVAVDLGGANLDKASSCFKRCTSLKMIKYDGHKLPEGIFGDCKSLKSVMLGSNVDSIMWSAFEGCTGLDTLYCESPAPPTLPTGQKFIIDSVEGGGDVILGHDEDAWAFDGLDLPKINLVVAPDVIPVYRKTDIWKEMNIIGDEDYVEPLLPVGGTVGEDGTWSIASDGTLTLDYEGSAWTVNVDGKNVRWHDLLASWMPFITRVVISDRVKTVPAYLAGEHDPANSAGVVSVEIGSHVTEVNNGSLNYSGLKDVYCYAESSPICWNTAFDWEAIAANNATLHVVTSPGVLERYQKSKSWSQFPNIVADLTSRMPAGIFHSPSAEGLEIWYRVTDEDAKTCETFVNDVTGRAVEMNSYTHYDQLTIPETVQYNSETYTVTGIGDDSFYGCMNFDTFILPEGLENIGVNAFNSCWNVHEFTLPASVKYIGEYAFEMWTNIERFTVSGTTPPTVDDNFINTYWDPDMRPKPTLLVPDGCRNAWNVAPWNKWFNVIDPFNKGVLTYRVKPGAEFYDYYQNDEEYMCIEGLKALNVITYENEMVGRVWDDMIEDWSEIWGDVYYNQNGKKLFYLDDESRVQIFEGVTSADNIYYEFKEEDFETMMYTTGRNVDLYKGAAIVFPESGVQTDIYFTATNEDGIDISYRVLDDNKKTCEVKADPNGYTYNAVSSDVSDVKVPFSAGGYVVTGIAADAFNGLSSLQCITLPSSIRSIGANAFNFCENVVTVSIDCMVPPMLLDEDGFLTDENNYAFENIGVPAGTDMGGALLYVPYEGIDAYNVYPWNYWFSSGIIEDPDAIKTVKSSESIIQNSWFDLSGRKFDKKPTKAGLYIFNGKKVVIK